MVISPSVLLRMRNASEKIRIKNKAFVLRSMIFFNKSAVIETTCKKYSRDEQAANEFITHTYVVFNT